MELSADLVFRLVLAFLFGNVTGFLWAVYFNKYRLWGRLLRLLTRSKNSPPTRVAPPNSTL